MDHPGPRPTFVHVTFEPTFNSSPHSAAYMRKWIGSALVQIKACRLFGAKPLPESNADFLLIWSLGTNLNEIRIKIQSFSFTENAWKCRLRYGGHFAQGASLKRVGLCWCVAWPLRGRSCGRYGEHTRVRQYPPAVTAIKIFALLPGTILTSKFGERIDRPQPGLT